jgi:predicted peroxiredoxin
MILNAYNKSEIARLYFQKKGKNLTKQDAANRWRMIQPDVKTLKEVFKEIHRKQMSQL